jgi:glycosyltransferase involved in cell wall biosynthesis
MAAPSPEVTRAGAWLIALEDRFGPDVVHLNGFAHLALPWRAPRLVVGHSCLLSWWEAVKGGPAPGGESYREAVRAGLAAADLLVTPTAAMRDALERHYGPLPPARVVPNGRGASVFPSAAKEPVVFSAGALWDEAANLAILEEVAGRLSWPVYVAGETRPPESLDDTLTPRLQSRRTHPLGPLSQRAVAAWLARSSVYALPARYEPFGLTAVEAALAGCALVLGDVPGLREVWGDGALYVAPDDAGALAAAIEELVADPEARRERARAARARARILTPDAMVEGYLAAYAELPADSLWRLAAARQAPERIAV